MGRFVLLLRAVNVGGRSLKMSDAREVLQRNGFRDVASYIQTGNFVVTTALRSDAKVEAEASRALSGHAGYDIVVIARRTRELTTLVEQVDGIPALLDSPRARYVTFCTEAPTAAAAAALEAWEAPGEAAKVLGKDVLVEFEVPFNEATLTGARLARILGVAGTARSMTVVRAMAEKWGSDG
jgi:uncharacterized protein (DUF1697 family)